MKLPANGIKCACGQASADDELHILNCHLGNQIIHRHNAVVQVFMDLLQSAGQTATSEERVTEASPLRSDFTIKRNDHLNSRQQHQHYDVIVVNPASSTYIKENKTHLVTGAAALRAHNMKIRKYAQLINKDDFHPMVFETLGYWTEEVTKLINNCC